MTNIDENTPWPGYWFDQIDSRLHQGIRDELGSLGLRRGGWRVLHVLAEGPASASEIADKLSGGRKPRGQGGPRRGMPPWAQADAGHEHPHPHEYHHPYENHHERPREDAQDAEQGPERRGYGRGPWGGSAPWQRSRGPWGPEGWGGWHASIHTAEGGGPEWHVYVDPGDMRGRHWTPGPRDPEADDPRSRYAHGHAPHPASDREDAFERGFVRGFERGTSRGGRPMPPWFRWSREPGRRIDGILAAFTERGWVWFDGESARLTDEGRAAHDAAYGRVQAVKNSLIDGIDEADMATTLATLEAMARNVGWRPEDDAGERKSDRSHTAPGTSDDGGPEPMDDDPGLTI